MLQGRTKFSIRLQMAIHINQHYINIIKFKIMNIETKFKVGDTVYTVDPETLKIKQFEIGSVSSITSKDGTTVLVWPKTESYISVNEKKCFPTREALIDHITKP